MVVGSERRRHRQILDAEQPVVIGPHPLDLEAAAGGEDCDGDVDCDDADCSGDPACQACTLGQRGDACSQNSDCCSNKCKGNGTCK